MASHMVSGFFRSFYFINVCLVVYFIRISYQAAHTYMYTTFFSKPCVSTVLRLMGEIQSMIGNVWQTAVYLRCLFAESSHIA